jgi:hypothetical protein
MRYVAEASHLMQFSDPISNHITQNRSLEHNPVPSVEKFHHSNHGMEELLIQRLGDKFLSRC